MQLHDFDFDLPPKLIAQVPTKNREDSRLLVCQKNVMTDSMFRDIGLYFQAGDVLVLNNTKVMKARLQGKKASGGQIEVLVEKVLDTTTALCLLKASHAPKETSMIYFAYNISARIIKRQNDLFYLKFKLPLTEVINAIGHLPLPPYIHHKANQYDEARYQTVFSRHEGAIAAPTAGLHFTAEILDKLKVKGVSIVELTLHVGAGTFQPIRTENIEVHRMHKEWFSIPSATAKIINQALLEKRRICAVGTTSLRALESAFATGKIKKLTQETDIFIRPGYRFQVVDRLLTNFHLPKSTLIILVSAFAGLQNIKNIYAHAIKERYRFFSYGDCMLLERSQN